MVLPYFGGFLRDVVEVWLFVSLAGGSLSQNPSTSVKGQSLQRPHRGAAFLSLYIPRSNKKCFKYVA